MRDPEGIVPGLLLVDVARERFARVVGRPLSEHAREEHRENPHVRQKLVPEVDGELILRSARDP